MASADIVGRRGRRRIRTTIPAKKPAPFADLVKRRFKAASPNELWCGDLTYVHTGEGFLYLSTVIDVHSRRVIGWAIATHLRAELVSDALRMALANRCGQVRGVVFHSDRGAQYGAGSFKDLARSAGVRQSMGRVADCFDNALAESFFATLKCELLYPRSWPTRQDKKCDRPLDRGYLQPPASAQLPRNAGSCALRAATPGTAQCSLTKLSTRSGQVQRSGHPGETRGPYAGGAAGAYPAALLCLAVCVCLNHQLRRPSRALVDYCA